MTPCLHVGGVAEDLPWLSEGHSLKGWLDISDNDLLLHRYGRLKWLRDSGLIGVNRALVNLVSFLHIAPHGLRDVHEMLVKVSLSLVQGGESGVFSPMHLLIFKKPEQE